jgi:hypothetical protein
MERLIRLAGTIAVVALLIVGGPGLAAQGAESPSSTGSGGAIEVQQVPITPYMASQVGTPNELSPLAPSQAKNVRKEKGQWLCDINGQTYVFDGASSWVPKPN